MFSLAVTIPYDSESQMYDTSQVTDTADDVRDEILKCEVYTGRRVVAATVLRWPDVVDQCPNGRVQWRHVLTNCGQTSMTWGDVKQQCPSAVREGTADHAEYRTLQHLNTLVENLNENDLLLFYVLSSPCVKRCTSESSHWNILNSINQILKWKNYAVVFSKVFKPRKGAPIPEQELRGALERLGTHRGSLGSIGLSNIFRCDGQPAVQCTSCSNGNQVARYCVSGNSEPSYMYPQQGRSDSPSQSGRGDRGEQGRGQGSTSRGKVRKVGGRRVGKKQRDAGYRQKSEQSQSKKQIPSNMRKETQSRGTRQWREEVQRWASRQSNKRQRSKSRGRSGEMRRADQLQKRWKKKKRG